METTLKCILGMHHLQSSIDLFTFYLECLRFISMVRRNCSMKSNCSSFQPCSTSKVLTLSACIHVSLAFSAVSSQECRAVIENAHPMADYTQRQAERLIPLPRTQWESHTTLVTCNRAPSIVCGCPSLTLQPLLHCLLHRLCRRIAKRGSNILYHHNPVSDLPNPTPRFTPIQYYD